MNKQKQVKRIFDSISGKYDLLNHLLSAGVDYYWRKKALKLSKVSPSSKLLDIACGTGDFSITAKKMGVNNIIGADLSGNMMQIFHEKAIWSIGNTVQSVAENLPFKNNSFTNITVAFGVRNFYDIREGLKSFYRVLDNKGKATILEFRLPENRFIKFLYLFYFQKILPLIGKLISKDNEAYTYLPESVDKFDSEIDLKILLKEAGFEKIEYHSLTFGLVQVLIAEKN